MSANLMNILKETQAIITNTHVVYTSGKHGNSYINKDAIYPNTENVSAVCKELAEIFIKNYPSKEILDVDVVVGPALGGIILSQYVAHHLSQKFTRPVLAVYADKTETGFVVKRGYDKLCAGKNVIVVEDILTTGGSVKAAVEAVRLVGGNVVAVGAICNRGKVTTEMLGNVPVLHSLLSIELEAWDQADCQLCAQGVPINVDVGKGREFLARKS
jgi:orotate phosphoribosyltransferase